MIPYGRQSVDQTDIDAVVEVARLSFPDHFEDRACFQNRLALYPRGCFVLAEGDGAARGYLIAYPWKAESAPPLNTVIEGLPNTARMCREEIFGPVLALLPWSDEADLIAQCNDNDYGLASGIWTRDYKAAWRIGRALQTGTVWINTYKLFSVSTPFGWLIAMPCSTTNKA